MTISTQAPPTFGRWLKQRRHQFDLTQADLADRVGCSPETIRKFEADRLRPSRQMAERLLEQLQLPADERAPLVRLARARTAPATAENPYVGLRAFEEADAARFFGREALVAQLVALAERAPLLAVIGASGSGKSSLVRAGLVPALRAGALPGSERWRYALLRPGPRPLDALAAALAEQCGGALADSAALRRALADDEHALALVAAALGLAPGERLVLAVDQLEELWSLEPEDPAARAWFEAEQRLPFIRLLLAATRAPVLAVLTLRADFLGRAAEHAALAAALGANDVIVGPLSDAELRAAVERPALDAGGAFEPGLVDALVAQAGGRPGALPLLADALHGLWQARRPDGALTWAALRAMGGVEGALAARADALMERYTAAQRVALRHALLRLVQPGDGATVARRRVALADLVPAGGDEAAQRALLAPLAEARLLALDADADGAETVELAHEALLGAWPTLAAWVEEGRAALRLARQIEGAAREWQASANDTAFLWRGARLAQAGEQAARGDVQLSEREVAFLAASQAHAHAEAQRAEAARVERAVAQHGATRLRLFLLAAGALLLLAVALALVALNQRGAAVRSAQQEQHARATAEAAAGALRSLALAGEAVSELERKPERALLLALAAQPRDSSPPPPAARQALYRAFEGALIRRTLRGHTGAVRAVAWAPDGQYAATGSDDAQIRIWRVSSGETTQTIAAGAPVRALAWSADGTRLLSGDAGGAVVIWNVATGAPARTLQASGAAASAVAWRPKGAQALSASYDGNVRVWNVASGTLAATLANGAGSLRTAAWRPDGTQLVAGGDDGVLRVWDVATRTVVAVLRGPPGGVRAAAWSPDGTLLVAGYDDGAARVWDVATGSVARVLQGHSGWVWAADWSADGAHILTASLDGTARSWDAASGAPLRTLRGHAGAVWAAAWSDDGTHILTGGDDRSVRLWDAATGVTTLPLPLDRAATRSLSWSPTGTRALAWSDDGSLQLWDASSGRLITTQNGHRRLIRWASWSDDGRQALTVDEGGAARRWDAARGAALPLPADAAMGVEWGALSVGGSVLAAGDADGRIRLWDLQAPARAPLDLPALPGVTAAAWSADARTLALGQQDGTVTLVTVATGATRALHGHTARVRALVWSHDDMRLLSSADDGAARIWDTASGAALQTLAGHSGTVLAAAWGANDDIVFTGGVDGTARVWDAATGAPQRTLAGQGSAARVAPGADGAHLMVGSADGYAATWLIDDDAISADVVRRACNLVAEDELRATVAGWRGCAAELRAAEKR